MTRPLAAAALLAGVLAILYTTSWAQQPDSAQQPGTEPIAEEVVDASEMEVDLQPRSRSQTGYINRPQPGAWQNPPTISPAQPSEDGRSITVPAPKSSGQGYSTMGPPGTYQGIIAGSLIIMDTRTGQAYRRAENKWVKYLPPVHPDAAESTEAESRLQAREKQLKRQILEMRQQISNAEKQLEQIDLEQQLKQFESERAKARQDQ